MARAAYLIASYKQHIPIDNEDAFTEVKANLDTSGAVLQLIRKHNLNDEDIQPLIELCNINVMAHADDMSNVLDAMGQL